LDIVAGQEHARGAGFVIFYHGTSRNGGARTSDEVDRVAWFDPHRLPQLAFRATAILAERWLAGELRTH
jgi:hypothetical protein